MNEYRQGQDVAIRADFRDGGRALQSPDTVTVTVVSPSGDTTALVATSTATGRFTATFDTSTAEAGIHRLIVAGSGGLVAGAEVEFLVTPLPSP